MDCLRAVFVIICVRLAGLTCAAPSSNSYRSLFPRDEQSQSFDAPITNQPTRLERGSSDEQQISLLSVVRRLQQRPLAAVATAVRSEGVELSGQSAHERTMLTDMGHLEDQLESWKEAEINLEKQVTDQSAALEAMKADQMKAMHDEQIAAMVWWDCKMLLCALAIAAVAFCVCVSSWQSEKVWVKPNFRSAEKTNDAEQSSAKPQAMSEARCAPQPEFIEKGAREEAEDVLQVTLPVSHLTTALTPDLEAPASVRQPAEDVWEADWLGVRQTSDEKSQNAPSVPESPRSSACEYFNLEEPEPTAVPQDDATRGNWWTESAAAY